MCENCNSIVLKDRLCTPKDYIECIEYIKRLLSSGDYDLLESSCDISEVKTSEGNWAADIICHVIRCKNCGQKYTCYVNTYRGGGSFKRGR